MTSGREIDAGQVLAALGTLVEARDPYTAGHQARVAELAVCIARELGLDDGRVQGLRLAALVHDVGKIVIPSSLLMKPTPLTDLERELMCTHVAAGVSVLDGIAFPWPVVRMVEQHHERIDGSGYPYGIGDAELLFESKILGVADTLEALTSHRPYRPAISLQAALDQLSRQSDRTFDGRVVDACLAIHRDERIFLAPARA
jgi:putative nucleotidyltransferase with HDIG domain